MATFNLLHTLKTPSKSNQPSLSTSCVFWYSPLTSSPLTSASRHCFFIHTILRRSSTASPDAPLPTPSPPIPAINSRLASHVSCSARDHAPKDSSVSATMCSAFHFGVDDDDADERADAKNPPGELLGDEGRMDDGARQV